MTKKNLDALVAGILGIHQSQVSLITTTFLRLAGLHLAKDGLLFLDGLGKFTRRGMAVDFRRSRYVHQALKENPMDKLGVEEGQDQEKMEKAANQGCPKCGATPERHGNILSCPNCGTEPFEKSK